MMKTNLFKRAISAISATIIAISANAFTFPATTNAAVVETPDYIEMTDRIIYLVNEARAEAGLEPVYAVPYLNDLAEIRAEECVEEFSHSRSNGDYFYTIIDYDEAPWMTSAENIASGMATPEATFEQWRNSPSHWSAIMNPNFTHMGVGVAYDPDSVYGWYWEQLFIEVDTFEAEDGTLAGQYMPDEYQIIPQAVGDIDGDGVVDSFDYVMICRYLTKQVTLNPRQIESADILKDGVITWSDAAYLMKYILGEVETLPVKLF